MISTPHEYVALLERPGPGHLSSILPFSPATIIASADSILAGHDLPALEVTYPHSAPGRRWVVPEAPVVTGRPA
jgi:hypothetical protein